MRSLKSYSIIGTGGLGGYYGCELLRAEQEVHFLLRSDYAQVKEHGLHYESKGKSYRFAEVSAWQDAVNMPKADFCCLCTKTTSNSALEQMLKPALGANSAIAILQNGLGVDEQVMALCPGLPVIAVSCFLCAHKPAPGHIIHEDYGHIEIAAANPIAQPLLEDFATGFRVAGIRVSIVESLAQLRWRKLVWNIPFNGLCTVLNATTQELLDDPQCRLLCEEMMAEVCAAAAACGADLPEDYPQKMLHTTAGMVPYAPSMQLDFRAGRSLEVDTMYGEALRRAAAAGVPMLRVGTLAAQLALINKRISKPRIQLNVK